MSLKMRANDEIRERNFPSLLKQDVPLCNDTLSCTISHSYVVPSLTATLYHLSQLRVPSLTATCAISHSYVYHLSQLRVPSLTATLYHLSQLRCTISHSYVYHLSQLRVPSLTATCTISHSYVYHLSQLRCVERNES